MIQTWKKEAVIYLLVLVISLVGVGCGGSTPAPTSTPAIEVVQEGETGEEIAEEETLPVIEEDVECPDYLQFCVTTEVSGTVTASNRSGTNIGGSGSCAEWLQGDEYGILTLPFLSGVGTPPLTIALTRIGQYKGVGEYRLVTVSQQGNPDFFPAVRVAERAFSEGEGSEAVVTISADGSGSLIATGLTEMESMMGVTPDPTARIDLTMRWTCRP